MELLLENVITSYNGSKLSFQLCLYRRAMITYAILIFQTSDIVFETYTEVATQEICVEGEQRLSDGTCGE